MGSVSRVLVVLMVVVMVGAIGAQQLPSPVTDCFSQLLPGLVGCSDAVSNPSAKPSDDCCKGVKQVVKDQMKCLCLLYNTPSVLETYKINSTRVLEIPGLCGVSASISACNTTKASGASPTSSAHSPASSAAPAPTAGSDNKSNGGLRLTWSIKPLWALGFLWVPLIMV